MRKLFFFVILAIGAGIGLLVAIAAKGEWGAGAVMAGIGLLFAVPLASALTGIGRGRRSLLRRRSGGGAGGASKSLFKGDVPIRRWDR
jgi:hypothetical protein